METQVHKNMIRVALAQINSTVGDLTGNQNKIIDYINQAKSQRADIVVFPELTVCGYPPEDLLYKKHFIKDNLKVVQFISKHAKNIVVIVGFADLDKNNALYNAAGILSNGKITAVYHKHALPNYGVFDEKRYFAAGKNNKIFSLGKNFFGMNICEDIWVEQGAFKEQVKFGARLLFNISSSPYDLTKLKSREDVVKDKAKKSNAFVCYVNLVGGQDELVFDGGSFIIDPKGKKIAAGKQFEEDLIVADIDVPASKIKNGIVNLGQIKSKVNREPITAHFATQYSMLERIYRALVLGTRDYIRKNGFQKVTIGLSGGIDSCLVAAIAVDAIGKENVIGVSMPSRYTSDGTRSDARILADKLGISFKEIPIEGIFTSYLETLAGEFKGLPVNIAEENIQARIRGNILMALSNKFGWMVLTTGNKSEVAVGYCTLYGDMSGGFAVIKDVPKTKVYELCRLRNQQSNVIPKSVFTRPPTAELRENQKDQDSLPEYVVLDNILERYVEKHESLAQITKLVGRDVAQKVVRLIDRNEYKRRQGAPGVKITPRAFGKDWRLPITNKYEER